MVDLRRPQFCLFAVFVFLKVNGFQGVCANTGIALLSSNFRYFVFERSTYPKDCHEVFSRCEHSRQYKSGVYYIKPNGYPDPFHVYCDNNVTTGGWTVIQRRNYGDINFNRTWTEFARGFGFLGSEFWLGNEKIAYLLNQKSYQLRLEFENVAGQLYQVTYDHFSIADELMSYSIVGIGTYGGTADSTTTFCPSNELYSDDVCERRCTDPNECIRSSMSSSERCVCPMGFMIQDGLCVPDSECGCYIAEKDAVLEDGESFVNLDCSLRINCSNNILTREENYACSDDARCEQRDTVRSCYCQDGFEGNGVTCNRVGPRHCQDIVDAGTDMAGTFTIYPDGWLVTGFEVRCENGWMVIQKRRKRLNSNFNRSWNDYKNGFRYPSGDFWLGNDKLHALTSQTRYKLRIDLIDSTGSTFYIQYDSFTIENEAREYGIALGAYSGTADQFIEWCPTNKQFSSYNCERTCNDPQTCLPANPDGRERCVCPENFMISEGNCIPMEECVCFVEDKRVVLSRGEQLMSSDCGTRYRCKSRGITTDRDIHCSNLATCESREGVRNCYCTEWFEGDGITCTRSGPRDCHELYTAGRRDDGVYTIFPTGDLIFQVYCKMSGDGGGWTVLQRRINSSVDFYRNWRDYGRGFGDLLGNHWLGNDRIHALTNQKNYRLTVKVTNAEGTQYKSRYRTFRISDGTDKYRLTIASYSGNTGNSMTSNSGNQFSTFNQDNDGSSTFNCAEEHRGGWWYPDDRTASNQCYTFQKRSSVVRYEYSDCACYCWSNNMCPPQSYYQEDCRVSETNCSISIGSHRDGYNRCCENKNPIYETNSFSCGYSNLNGEYQHHDNRGIFWHDLHGSDCGITQTTLMIRP